MIKCVIIDDEKPARDEISFLVKEHGGFDILGIYDSAKSFLENLSNLDMDLLFVDINMPGMTGIELVEHLRMHHMTVHVVFITAYDDFAIKAFELHAVDYLLKPVSADRMSDCLSRVTEHLNDHSYDEKFSQLMNKISKSKSEHISFHKDGKIVPIKLTDIIYIKAENKGTYVKTLKGSFNTSIQLREFEKRLMEEDFFKCHRSYLINLSYIEHIEPWFNRTYQVDLTSCEEKIPISRNYVQDFKDLMNIL